MAVQVANCVMQVKYTLALETAMFKSPCVHQYTCSYRQFFLLDMWMLVSTLIQGLQDLTKLNPHPYFILFIAYFEVNNKSSKNNQQEHQ